MNNTKFSFVCGNDIIDRYYYFFNRIGDKAVAAEMVAVSEMMEISDSLKNINDVLCSIRNIINNSEEGD